MEETKLELETFSMCCLQKKSYKNLKFLCKIWGLDFLFECCHGSRLENGRKYLGRKNEIVIRLRKIMRQKENQRHAYHCHTKISTPETIRPLAESL